MKIENTPVINTARLRLRKVIETDLEALFEVFSDESVNYFLPWFKSETKEQCYQFIKEKFIDYYNQSCAYRYVICLKETDVAIGYIVYSTTDSYDLGYGLAKSYWHQGYAQEATRALVQKIKLAGYPFVSATHDIENHSSGAVLKQTGFHYCYSYIEQWQPKNRQVTFRLYQLNLNKNANTFMGYWHKYNQHFIEELD